MTVTKQKTSQVVLTHLTIGIQLAIIILLFVYGGHYLDTKYNRSPLFVSIGTVLGMVIGFYNLMKELNSIKIKSDKAKKEDKDNHQKKVKWM